MEQSYTLQITSGRGPAECCWVVAQIVKVLVKEAKDCKLEPEVISRNKGGEKGTLVSAVVRISGKQCYPFVKEWIGTVQWIGDSPYRKMHKRKNWFVGIELINTSAENDILPKDLKIETFRSGGPGGQHVNKVSTAVRVRHIPTGLFATASDSRSQLQNRKTATKRLEMILKEKEKQSLGDCDHQNWMQHNSLERGNPIKIFKGRKFEPKKRLLRRE